jgi:transposase
MASAYSQDLRDRVIDAVIRGGMSRRAAAARFGVSESSAIKWVQRFERSGSRAASRMGGYLRPKLGPHREFLEALRREKSDITFLTPSPKPSRRLSQPNAKTISPAPDMRQPRCRML